ncbi:MAG: ATP phosphoribosyltransferase regulatory subunit, partial [Planctomycetaceae bacterium]
MNTSIIKPQTLKGFRDHLPEQMLAREQLIDVARNVYRSYGFVPIDTPALEFSEILLGKGGDESDRQLFRFTDQGGRDVALRFDLTVPLARFAAQHLADIGTPFKRYHIATVWRGERPQKGRYREFMQCDFDTIGSESNAADIETLLVIHDLIAALGFQRFTIRINNRLILNGLLEQAGLTACSSGILRALDKLPKIGSEAVIREMTDSVGASLEQAQNILRLGTLEGDTFQKLAQLEDLLAESALGREGVAKLSALFRACDAVGVPAERLELDVSIARGLDYYTG